MSKYFFSTDIPIYLQVGILASLIVLHLIALWRLRALPFGPLAVLTLLSLVFLAPYTFSISSGSAGFNQLSGLVPVPETNPTLLALLLWQSLLIPAISIFLAQWGAISRGKKLRLLPFSSVFEQSLFFLLSLYFIAFMSLESIPLFRLLSGDVIGATSGRIEYVLQATHGTVKYPIFNFVGLAQMMINLILLMRIGDKIREGGILSLKVLMLTVVFFLINSLTFSKGYIVAALIFFMSVFSTAMLDRGRRLSLVSTVAFLAGAFIILVSYRYYTHEAGISLQGSIGSILSRLYNNSSSVYLQMKLFERDIPLGMQITNWGFFGRLFEVDDAVIPKAQVMPFIYGREGQSGSTLISELYMFSGHLAWILILFVVVFLGFLNRTLRAGQIFGIRVSKYALCYFGLSVVLDVFNQPFRVFSPFLLFRPEYLILILLIFLLPSNGGLDHKARIRCLQK